MEAEHIITKELILGHEQYEKLDNSNGLEVLEVKRFQSNLVLGFISFAKIFRS